MLMRQLHAQFTSRLIWSMPSKSESETIEYLIECGIRINFDLSLFHLLFIRTLMRCFSISAEMKTNAISYFNNNNHWPITLASPIITRASVSCDDFWFVSIACSRVCLVWGDSVNFVQGRRRPYNLCWFSYFIWFRDFRCLRLFEYTNFLRIPLLLCMFQLKRRATVVNWLLCVCDAVWWRMAWIERNENIYRMRDENLRMDYSSREFAML